jgi:GTP pyrophosphokinase
MVQARQRVPVEIENLLETLREAHPSQDLAPVVAAYEMASRAHAGQMRKSGEPFISHPLSVAMVLAEMGMDTTSIVAALLHDAVEDTDLSLQDLREPFGDELAEIIDGLTKIKKIGFRTLEQAQAESYRKMVVAMARDVRVIIIKLVDRLDNMRTLDPLPPAKQELKAKETLEIYVPLANRLGMAQMKAELEDLGFKYLYPKRYAEVVDLTERRQPERDRLLEVVLIQIRDSLSQAKIKADVSGRAKNVFSIYQKMVERDREFDDIFDLVGVRIVVPTMNDCYTALGVIHALWKPIPGRFKDYVAMPKFNMYQSLHTTVMGPEGRPLEIQIRTTAMHRMAEFGVSAHWRYKELGGRDPSELPWLGEMADTQREARDPREFMESLRLDLFHDEVFCFTPKGDVKCLPRGAGPVDFAYAIHTEVGHRTVGARVNGRLVPLETRLESGDVVEVMTTKSQEAHPKQDWLAFVKTSRARSKIKQWIVAHRREEARETGRDMFVRALRREGIAQAAVGDAEWRALQSETRSSGPDALYEGLGEGRISTQSLAIALRRIFKPEEAPDEPERPAMRKPKREQARTVVVLGAEDVFVKLAGCCAPVPGDPIFGFVTLGKGVSVHREDCPNARSLLTRRERLVDVEWDTSQGGRFVVVLQVRSLDRVGLLRDISNCLSEEGVNIVSSSTGGKKDGTSTMRFSFELGDVAHLDHILSAVRKIEGVFDVYRVLPLEARSGR